MIYPENFEKKIGFDEIRTLLKGRCMSALGTEWVDRNVTFKTDFATIQSELNCAQEFQRFEMEQDGAYEANFFDVREALMHIRPERTYMEEVDLFSLKRSMQTVSALVQAFRQQDEDADDSRQLYPTLATLAEDVETFDDIVARIDEVLNKYGRVKDTASPELLTIRRNMEQTSRGIGHSLRTIIQEAQAAGYIDRDVSPTLRDGRLVIPVSPSAKRKIKGIVHDESATGKTVFIEPADVVEANNRIRELQAAEKREVIRLLQELSNLIRPRIPAVLDSLRFLAHIDYLRALSSFSEATESVVPSLVNRPVINLQHAVHPLLQKSLAMHGKSMNPLDIRPSEGKRLLIISGPNAGGKSVCLKTLGLLQYMLQCGMPVPVSEQSEMGVFDDIFIDIGDEQSLTDELSTYSGHLMNMKQMIRHSTNRSLLLIDEFGAGTEPQIGGALAEAILQRFIENGSFGIITTHYQNLKRVAEHFETVENGAMLYDRSLMQPLFRLQIGNPGSSFAIEIARKIGLPEDVIAAASEMVGKNYILSDKYLQDIVRDRMYWERKRKNIHTREKQLEAVVTRYEGEMDKLNRDRKEVIAKAKEEAEQMLSQSNAQIENTIRAIREAQADKEKTRQARQELEEYKQTVASNDGNDDRISRKMERIRQRQERRQQGKAMQQKNAAGAVGNEPQNAETPRAHVKEVFKQGDVVRLDGQQTVGEIEGISGKNARVVFGMIHLNVSLSRLRHAERPKEDNVSRVATFLSKETRDALYEKKLHFSPEIDLRGFRADEAMRAVATYIDDAISLEYPQVRILHGTGTGALREVIRTYLGTVPGVRKFHDEHVQFGGAGITVVEF